MVTWAALGTGAKVGVVGVAGVAVAGVAALVLRGAPEAPAPAPVLTPEQVATATGETAPEPAALPVVDLPVSDDPATPTAPEDLAPGADSADLVDPQPAQPEAAPPEPAASADPTPPPADPTPDPILPLVDTFSLDQDGLAVIAGRGEAGAALAVMLDGTKVDGLTLDAAGRFATVLTLPPSDLPRSLHLVQTGADGQPRGSEATIIVAPFAVPVQSAPESVAQAPLDPAPEPVAQAQEPAPVADPIAEPIAEAPTSDAEPVAQAPATPVEPVAQAPDPEPTADPSPAQAGQTATPSNLVVSSEEVRVMRAPDAALPLSIDTIAYADQGGVVIAGRGPALGSVRLYLDNALKVDTLSDDAGGWRVTLGDVEAGLYTLRADALDASGKVTARAETPFLREPPAQLATFMGAPDVAEPSDTATEPMAQEDHAPAADPVATPEVTPSTPEESPAVAEAPEPASPASAPADAPVTASIVTVQPGYTLWSIARDTYGEGIAYVKVFEANRTQIRNPDLIYPGQVFELPAQ